MSFHSDTIFWFRANQSLLFLLNAVCLSEKQQIPNSYSLVWLKGSNPQSTTRGEHTNYYTTVEVDEILAPSVPYNKYWLQTCFSKFPSLLSICGSILATGCMLLFATGAAAADRGWAVSWIWSILTNKVSKLINKVNEIQNFSISRCYIIECTETCKKYSVTVIFYYMFHIKPHF